MNPGAAAQPTVLIVCEHASARFGGEAILPLHYFRLLRRRGIEVHLVTHARTRDELLQLLPTEAARLHFIKDTLLNKLAWRIGKLLPAQIAYFTLGYASRVSTQLAARRVARRLVSEHGVDVVHQPIPVSPREPSLLHGMKAPVVIGPMNGNMSYPPAFVSGGRWRMLERIVDTSRLASRIMNRLIPGKLRAAALLVANERTRDALPKGVLDRVVVLPENGVDLQVWFPAQRTTPPEAGRPTRFIFAGRLVDWKAVDLLLEAVARLDVAVHLDVIGDGPMRPALEALTARFGITGKVRFHGWLSQGDAATLLRASDVLVLPSIYECGGAVVLEAMATALPVIATEWGGPADYLDASCGILVAPNSREDLVRGFATAMKTLHELPELRHSLGQAGRRKVEREYDWDTKIDAMLRIYARAGAGWRTVG
jgi:glycosyltransferase involved in cell wall biosynthesis